MKVWFFCQCRARVIRQFADQESLDRFADLWIEKHIGEGHRPGCAETSEIVRAALERYRQREKERELRRDLQDALLLAE